MFKELNISSSTKSYIYFMTDRNRSMVTIGHTDNLNKTMNVYHNMPELFFDGSASTMRLVYFEEHNNEMELKHRYNDLQKLTKAQKERLIRSINPNWVNLSLRNYNAEIVDPGYLKANTQRMMSY